MVAIDSWEAAQREWSEWIQSYPIVEGTIAYANSVFKKAMAKKLLELSKKHKVPHEILVDYYGAKQAHRFDSGGLAMFNQKRRML